MQLYLEPVQIENFQILSDQVCERMIVNCILNMGNEGNYHTA